MAEAILARPRVEPAPTQAAAAAGIAAVPWAEIVVVVACFRLLVSLAAAFSYLRYAGPGQPTGLLPTLLEPWRQFDALRFTTIAAHGYGTDSLNTAYMPLYPLLIRMGSLATFGHYLSAALVISNLVCIPALGLFWRWVADRFDTRVAWRTIAVLLIYPDSFYLLGAYSESLFLALCAAALLAIERKRLGLAGLLALLATLTRLQGLVLCLPILLSLRDERQPRVLLTGLGAATIPAAGLLLYQKLLSTWLGGGAILTSFQQKWHIALLPPWATIGKYITVIRSPQWHFVSSPTANYVQLWDLIAALLFLAVVLVSARRLGLDLTLFGLAAWCFGMSRYASTGRYMLAVLPAFIGAALWLEGRRLSWLAWVFVPILFIFICKFAQGSWVD